MHEDRGGLPLPGDPITDGNLPYEPGTRIEAKVQLLGKIDLVWTEATFVGRHETTHIEAFIVLVDHAEFDGWKGGSQYLVTAPMMRPLGSTWVTPVDELRLTQDDLTTLKDSRNLLYEEITRINGKAVADKCVDILVYDKILKAFGVTP